MATLAARLHPGDDLLGGIVALAHESGFAAPYVATCVGSLSRAALRMAGADGSQVIDGTFEIISLVGTVAAEGAHLHLSVSDPDGAVLGGHLLQGSIVRTTAEVVLGDVDGVRFRRPLDPATGWDELLVEPRTDRQMSR